MQGQGRTSSDAVQHVLGLATALDEDDRHLLRTGGRSLQGLMGLRQIWLICLARCEDLSPALVTFDVLFLSRFQQCLQKKKKKLIPTPRAMKIPDAKAVDKEWEELEKWPAGQVAKVMEHC